jgi:hypothetical protein
MQNAICGAATVQNSNTKYEKYPSKYLQKGNPRLYIYIMN